MFYYKVFIVYFGVFLNTKCEDFTFHNLKSKVSALQQGDAARGVIQRLIPDKASLFNVTVDQALGPPDKDTFKITKDSSSEVVQIVASSAVAGVWGFHHYLKHYCGCHVSWEADQLALPDQLPAVNITITSVDRFRYYQNVCTTSYSFAWWNWSRWEREIDWMALNGINLALAFTGQEAIWQRVYKKLNLTDNDIDEHFAGPAFLAWGRMGNIRGWGGPLSEAWHNTSVILQHKILNRMRELGIVPILPAFAGHVPKAFKRLFPDATMTMMGTWNSFSDDYCCPYLLEPTDPLFKVVGSMFITELTAEFGTDHVYNCDTFNEMSPATSNTTYLANVGAAIFEAITDIDSEAIWILQGWFFLDYNFWKKEQARAFLRSVPIGRMIVLDLQADLNPQYVHLQSYFGQPFIWCMLHNFGGTLGLYGAVYNVNKGIFEGRAFANSTMIGIGLTPEGINQNYVVYDLMNDMGWRNKPINLTKWFNLYATRRYGANNENANNAWQIMKASIYNCKRKSMHGHYILSSRPALGLTETFWYDPVELATAWDELLVASSQLNSSAAYQHDLVDVTRQCLQVLASGYYSLIVKAFRRKNTWDFKENVAQFIRLLNDLELLLASNKAFLLGPWLNSAKALATTQLDQELFEYNARNQITLWGPRGEIRDYANKQWSGVIADYFIPRWKLFFKELKSSLTKETSFNETEFNINVFNLVENPFTLANSSYPDSPHGDSVSIAQTLHSRWRYEERVWRTVLTLKSIHERGAHPQKISIGKGSNTTPSKLFYFLIPYPIIMMMTKMMI